MIMCKKKKLCKLDHYKTRRHYISLKNTDEMRINELKIYEMNNCKPRSVQKVLLHKRDCLNKMTPAILAVLATFCMIFISAVSYRSIRTSANSGFKYYTSLTVENGETLWDIADKYVDYDHYKNKNSYITEVQHINHLDENCSIDAGQILILPYYSNQYIK